MRVGLNRNVIEFIMADKSTLRPTYFADILTGIVQRAIREARVPQGKAQAQTIFMHDGSGVSFTALQIGPFQYDLPFIPPPTHTSLGHMPLKIFHGKMTRDYTYWELVDFIRQHPDGTPPHPRIPLS